MGIGGKVGGGSVTTVGDGLRRITLPPAMASITAMVHRPTQRGLLHMVFHVGELREENVCTVGGLAGL